MTGETAYSSRRPLAGRVVIELAGIGPGPFACSMLAQLGAVVIRVERPGTSSAGGEGLPGGLDRIGIRDRIIVELDIKTDEGRALARTMISGADALVEGFRPGVAERLGLGPEWALEANPSLVYARITGWGQEGPYSSMAGHDINYIGLSGVLGTIGTYDPVPPLNLVADYGGGGMFAVVGILAAWVQAERTGEGAVIDVAMVDGSAKLLEPIRDLLNAGMWIERRGANLLDGGAPFYRAYATADGRFMAVGALEPRFYADLLAGLGLDGAVLPDRTDPAHWDELTQRFASVFASRTREEWVAIFDGSDACVTPILEMTEVGDHPHNAQRRALLGSDRGPVPAPAPRFEGPPPSSAEAGTPSDVSISDTLVALGLSVDAVEDLDRGGRVHRV